MVKASRENSVKRGNNDDATTTVRDTTCLIRACDVTNDNENDGWTKHFVSSVVSSVFHRIHLPQLLTSFFTNYNEYIKGPAFRSALTFHLSFSLYWL